MPSTHTLIASYRFTGSENTITFNSLSGYRHIIGYANLRGTEASTSYIGTTFAFNGSSSSVSRIQLEGGGTSGSGLYANAIPSGTSIGYFPGPNNASNIFGIAEFLIPDYSQTALDKVIFTTVSGVGSVSATYGDLQGSKQASSTAAITSVTFGTTSNFAANSTIYIYGLTI